MASQKSITQLLLNLIHKRAPELFPDGPPQEAEPCLICKKEILESLAFFKCRPLFRSTRCPEYHNPINEKIGINEARKVEKLLIFLRELQGDIMDEDDVLADYRHRGIFVTCTENLEKMNLRAYIVILNLAYLPAFRCLEAVCWASLKHTCLRHMSQYAVFQDAFTIPTVVRHIFLRSDVWRQSMFESIVMEYLDKTKCKDWSVFGILEFARSNSKLSVATIDDFKEDLYSILCSYNDKCNIHVFAKNKAAKILSNFDSVFSSTKVRQFIKDLEYHEEARINVTSTYTATVLEDQRENQKLIDHLRETSNLEKGKEREKITRPLDAEDDDHSHKRQRNDDELSDSIKISDYEEFFIEWEFDTLILNWIERLSQTHQSLMSDVFQYDQKTRYVLSSNPFWWKIVDISDPKITDLMSNEELSELNSKFSSILENWKILEPEAERCIQSLEKLDNDQLRIIGETVRPKGTYGAILELQKLLENKKEQKALEFDNLFGDEKDFTKEDGGDHKEILSLTLEDHTNPDVAFIFDLIRYTCEMIAKGITQRSNSERDIDIFIKRHIFSCFDTILDSHFGEVVSRASRNRRAEAVNAPSNAEGYHLDWMFTRHDLDRELCRGREFSLCERTGSKTEDTPKIFSNTLKVQKTLRDMHRNLIETISTEGGGTLSRPVLQASTKLLMPGFLSSYFFMRAILIIYVGGGFYASANLADFYIPSKYQELEFIIKISRSMLQIKKLLSVTISWFKKMKNRAEKEKFISGKVEPSPTKDISPPIESHSDEEKGITPNPLPKIEHSSTQSESSASPIHTETKKSEDEDFKILDRAQKETISEKMREKNREKKLQGSLNK
ncbi:10787_t:CDS:10 [Acaulospora morrowiae]|uniref:10787_t:CDS:1 n=1 Tax=Acaulospora morrowiae TaxID=94023 RepID=A0A9N9FJ80_9GLOM|nr:10787_t:CDS:10 [Acaulospora morrowiae]